MKRLLVLWDPENPVTPVGPVLSALRATTEVSEVTFRDVAHRTLPNGAFEIGTLADPLKIDGLLWIEGGPLPSDLDRLDCPKACWLPNIHQEPTLLEDLGALFDRCLVSTLDSSADERARWLPLAASGGRPPTPPEGVSILLDDPKPPHHMMVERALQKALGEMAPPARPIVFCLGQKGRAHPMLLDCLRSGAAVVVDPESDLRGMAHIGEHLEVFPSLEELGRFTRGLAADVPRLERLSTRGPEIVEHLHSPELRAAQLRDAMWPRETVLGGAHFTPKVSILVTCFRYLKRFRFCLESLAGQDMPPGSIEVVVADPESPDGLADHLVEYAKRNPHLRVVRLSLDPRYHRNRGVGINRAFDASKGEVILSIDGDLIFPPGLVRVLVDQVLSAPGHVYGVQRRFIPKEVTEQILSGGLDPFSKFEELSRSEGDGEQQPFVGVLGYCQTVHRKAFARARYPEEFDKVNQSDIVFVERLAARAGVSPQFLEDQEVLHLWHPRNWNGTNDFL